MNAVGTLLPSEVTIDPVKGPLTEGYESMFLGMEGQPFQSRVLEVIDGLTSMDLGYDPETSNGYYNVMLSEHPVQDTGLKIHVPLNVDDEEEYVALFKRVVEVCALGEPTPFKVMDTYQQRMELRYKTGQGHKTVTIYPRAGDDGSNVQETIRLVESLGHIVSASSSVQNGVEVNNERESRPGVFVRPGALTRNGLEYEKASRSASFQDSVEGNLNAPGIDTSAMKAEIFEAIETGAL